MGGGGPSRASFFQTIVLHLWIKLWDGLLSVLIVTIVLIVRRGALFDVCNGEERLVDSICVLLFVHIELLHWSGTDLRTPPLFSRGGGGCRPPHPPQEGPRWGPTGHFVDVPILYIMGAP